MRLKTFLLPLLVFGAVFAGYLITPPSSQVFSDSRWSIHLALSVIREGNLNLDEYQQMIDPTDYAIQTIQGHQYSFFPIGAPLLAVPFVFIYNLFNPNTFALIARIHPVAQDIIASFYVALTAVLIYLIARLSLTVKQSLFITFIFAFCTSAWSTASRALWQHGPSMLFLSLALYLILLARNKPWLIQYASIPLAFSFVIRPTNAIPVFFLSFFILLYYRKYFVKYLLWSLTIALPYFVVNYMIYGMFISPYIFPYYHSTSIGIDKFLRPSISQLMGTLISPSRGLFVYSPVLLFSFFGIYYQLKNLRSRYPENMLDVFLVAIIISHYILISSFWHWWGGYSTGPRLFTDMIPYLIYFLIPAVCFLSSSPKKFTIPGLIFLLLMLVSFFIHFRGATSDAVYAWNNIPTSIDIRQARLWDWSDPPFLRGFSLLENIMPPVLQVDPDEIHLYCTGGDSETKCKTSIEIFTLPSQAFKWEAHPPPGVRVVPARGKKLFQQSRLTIHFNDTDYSPGDYDLGKLEISIARQEGAKKIRTVLIPVILRIESTSQE